MEAVPNYRELPFVFSVSGVSYLLSLIFRIYELKSYVIDLFANYPMIR